MGDKNKLQEFMHSYHKGKRLDQRGSLAALDPFLKKEPIEALQQVPKLASLLSKGTFVQQLLQGNGSIEEYRRGIEAVREYRDTLGLKLKELEKKHTHQETEPCQKAYKSLSRVFAHEQEKIKKLAKSTSHKDVYTAFALASPLPEARGIIKECMKGGKLQELLLSKKLPSYVKQTDLNDIVKDLEPSSALTYLRFASVLERIAHGDGSKEDCAKGEKFLKQYVDKMNKIIGNWQTTTEHVGDTQIQYAKDVLKHIEFATPALQDIQAYQSGKKQSMTAAAAKSLGLKPDVIINKEEKNEAIEVEKPKATR